MMNSKLCRIFLSVPTADFFERITFFLLDSNMYCNFITKSETIDIY